MTLDRKTSIIIGIAVLAIAVSGALLYMRLGVPGRPSGAAPGNPEPSPAAVAPAASGGQMTGKASLTLEEAADRLSKRLQKQDGSADDWTLLARSYVELRQYPDAVRAFEQAMKKAPDDAKLRSEAELARKAAAGTSAPR